MKKTLLPLSVVIILAVLISSCTKTGPQGPSGPTGPSGTTGPNLMGTLEGYVSTFDQYGYKVTSDQGGVLVKIDDAANDSATTDASGKYTFSNLATGTYNLTYSKANYGTFKAVDFGFVGGGTTLRNASLSQFPTFSLTAVNDTIETIAGTPGVLVRGTATADASTRSYAVFVSSSSSVSSNPANFTFANTNGTIRATNTNWGVFISSRELYDAGLNSGTTAYLAVYPIATGTPTYTDLSTGRAIYTAISASPAQVLTVTIP